MSDPLLTVTDIAAHLQLSVRHVRDRLIHAPSFPAPIYGRGRTRRWARSDFERWIDEEAVRIAPKSRTPRLSS